jgi:ABC-type branched-subunit amino acid transport system ATPase component/ABC-type branched-subunit amino acid transport system permease subunit
MARFRSALPFLLILAAALLVPVWGDRYWGSIATRAAIYWILVSGLNLVVGYAGQLAIGYVSLLTVGSYIFCIMTAKLGLSPVVALGAACGAGALFGVVVGLPALRLRTFYFAMTTLGFATIVTQVALAWTDVTGGGIGLPAPDLPAPFDTPNGFYLLCLGLASFCTWMTANLGSSRWGRAMVAIRDAEVAAEATGIAKPMLFVSMFLFSGALAGVAGGLFASLQSYITPDAFTFDLSVLFFIAILVGGRGSILGPLLGTIILTALPEFAAPLVAWSTFLYAVLLLVIVLVVPGGIADMLDFANRKPLHSDREIAPRPELLGQLLNHDPARTSLSLRGIGLSFGGLRAVDALDLDVHPGEVHGLIGPNGSGKTTTLNVICGFNSPQEGSVTLDNATLPPGLPQARAGAGIARTFQTPRIIGEATVIENVMIGGTIAGRGSFMESALCLPRHNADETMLHGQAMLALRIVGLESLAAVRADRLQHSELRFLEIARALMLAPGFLLLDEPAAGLSSQEITRLGGLIRAISRAGTGVLLVEHHADLIFDICDRVTVLNLGRELAAGTPNEIRAHKEVVSAYLGA